MYGLVASIVAAVYARPLCRIVIWCNKSATGRLMHGINHEASDAWTRTVSSQKKKVLVHRHHGVRGVGCPISWSLSYPLGVCRSWCVADGWRVWEPATRLLTSAKCALCVGGSSLEDSGRLCHWDEMYFDQGKDERDRCSCSSMIFVTSSLNFPQNSLAQGL